MIAISRVPIETLVADPANSRRHPQRNIDAIRSSLKLYKQVEPLVVQKSTRKVIGGNARLQVMRELGWKECDIVEIDVDNVQATALGITLNRAAELAEWDEPVLLSLLQSLDTTDLLPTTGFSDLDLSHLVFEQSEGRRGERPTMAERFLMAPFSVLNARDGAWQDRRRQWISMGISSQKGRDANLLRHSSAGRQIHGFESMFSIANEQVTDTSGTSVFDPVLCELLLLWFSGAGAEVLDPFAGGSVRGIVASVLGRKYCGVDIRQEQVDANRAQAESFGFPPGSPAPGWIVGDSKNLSSLLPADAAFDLILSCPPYHDLEQYSDDPADLSNMPWPEFLATYRAIIAQSVARLRENSFAVFVVGEIRDPRSENGNYRGFVHETVTAFEDAGAAFYNDAVLIKLGPSLGMRTTRPFVSSRKLGKTHQNVLVFVKGNAKAATERCGEVLLPDVQPGDDLLDPNSQPPS